MQLCAFDRVLLGEVIATSAVGDNELGGTNAWVGWQELPKRFPAWASLPSGVELSSEVFDNFAHHFVAGSLRDGVLDNFIPGAKVPALRSQLDLVGEAAWDRLCRWHDHPESVSSTHPHWARNFVLCPRFRSDRESPLIIKNVWAELSKVDSLGADEKAHAAIFILFARRVFHNYPLSWHKMQEFLVGQFTQQGMDPDSDAFSSVFERWAAGLGSRDGLYGRASHWFCPEINDERSTSCAGIGWLRDSLSLLRKF